MKKKVYVIVIMITFAAVALAQEGTVERDPFHPSEGRTTPAVTTQKGDPWGKDPFNNPLGGKVLAQKKEPGHNARGKGLTGIIYSSDVRLAIIGGEVLQEGSVIGDKKIADIRKRSVVVLNAAGGREELFLEDFSIGK